MKRGGLEEARDDAGGGFPRCSALFPRSRNSAEEGSGAAAAAAVEKEGGLLSSIFLARFSAGQLGRRPRVTLAETKRNAATPPGAPRKSAG